MENFQELMTQAAHLKQQELKSHRKQFEKLPDFLKAGLSYHKKYSQLRKQPFLLQYFVSENLKKQGNHEITKQQYQIGLHKYEESLAIFRYIQAKTNQNLKDQDLIYYMYKPQAQFIQMLDKHLSSLYLNISLCAIKQNKKQQALKSADQALKIDNKNPKIYYRKSQAHLQNINRSEQDISEGLKYLEITYQLSKQQEIHREIIKMKRLIQEEKKKAKKTFKFMINNNSNNQTVSSDRIKLQVKQEQISNQKSDNNILQKRNSNDINTQILISQDIKNTNHKTKQNKIVETNTNQVKQKQKEKQLKTQKKLIKMLDDQKWELSLLQYTITKKGQKILALLEIYNYKEYIQDYKNIFNKCLTLYKKSGLKKDSYTTTQKGEEVTIDFQQAEVKKLVEQQKLKIYNEYIQWLQKHPIPGINKYLVRFENQKKFLIQKQRQRQKNKIQKPLGRKVNDKKSSSNMLLFYSAALLILVWLGYNIYQNLTEKQS